MRLKDKVAVITGGSSGIGRATALKFAGERAKVVVADINETDGKQTAEQITAEGGEASFLKTDVTAYAEVERAVDFAVEQYGRIDTMFNNAGIGRFNPIAQHSPEDFDDVVKVNQHGVFYRIRAAAQKMQKLGIKGTIINTSSVFGLTASIGVIGYQAAKGAVNMMTQAAANELAAFGIRVVGVAPGGVDTPIIQGYKDAGLERRMAKMHMRGKMQQPEDIANIVAFLASDEAEAINGSIVMADDGFAAFKNAL